MALALNTGRLLLATVLAGTALLPMGLSYAAGGEEVIKARINFMKEDIGDQWETLAAFASKGKGSLSDVEKSAAALAKLAGKIPEHFPKNTGRGNYPAKMTRTLPAVWTDWDGFKKDTKRLADESAKLARLAKEGNKDAVVALIGSSGKYSRTKIGCAECHKSFRGKKVK